MEAPMPEKAELKQVFQVCVVVNNIEKSVEQYWKIFGIGPWQIRTFQPPDLFDTTLHGKPEPYTMKIAAARAGNIEWELIQPLSGRSSYREFLDKNGEGLHHVAVVVEDFDKTVSAMEKHGIGTVMTGRFRESEYAYLDTGPVLGFIAEILKAPPGFRMPKPDAVYPPPV
jgi:catechol 2,3-dioxygenase-like lactoylglutathione lyase family enzyme